MANKPPTKTILFKDVHDRVEVKLDEPGTYYFGLTTDGCLCAETDEDALCVKLFQVTFQHDGGCLLAPLNRDLKCLINSTKELNREINLVNGTTFEIAEKRIVFVDGSNQRRRHLPRTPGQSRDSLPPPKPARSNAQTDEGHPVSKPLENTELHPYNGDADNEDSDDGEVDEKKWLATANIMLDLPAEQQDKLNDLKTPEQISILAASYFTKQLRMFTDAVVSGELIDDIFRLFMETVSDCHDSYMVYLNSVSQLLAKVPDRTQHLPMHRPAVRLATDLLRSCFDPISHVILILRLIRTFSHFDKNLHTMIRHQTTAAVIGSMTAFNKEAEVQQNGLDILSKIANYAPKLGEKPQLKEVGIEQVIRGVKQHPDNMDIGRGACRVFANLSSTLISLLNQWIDTDVIDSQEKFDSLERIEHLQEFLFTEGIPLAQDIVGLFSQDLGVKMDFRRFVYFYAKHQHFKQKKVTWLSQQKVQFQENMFSTVTTIIGRLPYNTGTSSTTSSKGSLVISDSWPASQHETITKKDLTVEEEDHSAEESPQGILKKSRSYECLRTKERKLNFDSDTLGGSDSDSYSSLSDSNSFELHGPFQSEIPLEVDMEDDFSFHLVQHLVKKTVKRQNSMLRHPEVSDTSSSGSDDSDREFLESMSYPAQTKGTITYVPQQDGVKASSISVGVNGEDIDTNDKEKLKESELRNEATETFDSSVSSFDVTKLRDDAITTDCVEYNISDVYFKGKIVQTQITVHVISMVFQGEDTKVLQLVDQSIILILQDAGTTPGILQFAENQYGGNMTLMDLEPALVISIIDAVRYRSVAIELLQSALLSLTKSLSPLLQPSNINTAMTFYKTLFSNQHLQAPLTDESFLTKFRQCFQDATSRLGSSSDIEELGSGFLSPNFVI